MPAASSGVKATVTGLSGAWKARACSSGNSSSASSSPPCLPRPSQPLRNTPLWKMPPRFRPRGLHPRPSRLLSSDRICVVRCPESHQRRHKDGAHRRAKLHNAIDPLRPSAGLKAPPGSYTSPTVDRRHTDSALRMNALDFCLRQYLERRELMARFMLLSFARGASSACLANVMEIPSTRRRGV